MPATTTPATETARWRIARTRARSPCPFFNLKTNAEPNMINTANPLSLSANATATSPAPLHSAAHHSTAEESAGNSSTPAPPSASPFARVMKKAQAEHPARQAPPVGQNKEDTGEADATATALLSNPPTQAQFNTPLAEQPAAGSPLNGPPSGDVSIVAQAPGVDADALADSPQRQGVLPGDANSRQALATSAGRARQASLHQVTTNLLQTPRTALADASATALSAPALAPGDKTKAAWQTDPVQPDSTSATGLAKGHDRTEAPDETPVESAGDKPVLADPKTNSETVLASTAQAWLQVTATRAAVAPQASASSALQATEVQAASAATPPAAAAIMQLAGFGPVARANGADPQPLNRSMARSTASNTLPGDPQAATDKSDAGSTAALAPTPLPWAAANQVAVARAASAAPADTRSGQADDKATTAVPGTSGQEASAPRGLPAALWAQDPSQTPLAMPGLTGNALGSAPAAAATSTQAPIQAPVGSEAFAAQAGYQVAVFARAGVERAELQLNPADMGPVTVQIVMEGNTAMVHLSAHHADTRQALENAMPQLASSMRDAGLTLTGGGVFEQPRQPQSQDGSAADNRNNPGRRGEQDQPEAGPGLPLGPAPATSWLRPRGMVDLVA